MSPSRDSPVEAPHSSAPKVAIKGFSLTSKPGSKPISFATKNTHKPLSSSTPRSLSSSTLGKRPRTTLHDGSEDEDEDVARHEEVTGFDIREGGALGKEDATANGNGKGPLVIPKLRNRDWREEIRRNRQRVNGGKNLLPPEVQAQRRGEGTEKENVRGGGGEGVDGQGEVQWGLTIMKKAVAGKDDDSGADSSAQISKDNGTAVIETTTEVLVERPREKTDDELALEALLGVKSEKKGPDLVIPTAISKEDDEYTDPITEEDAYRRAIRNAPDVSTLEDYERVPVEEFGAALLRGMGWKEGDAKKGRVERPKDVKRRQNLLGLGATELKGAEELGAWVQKSDPKRLGGGGGRAGGRPRPRPNEYREREERKRESRDDRYGGSHRRERDDYRDRDRDRDRMR